MFMVVDFRAIAAGMAGDNLATFRVTKNDKNLGQVLWDPKTMIWQTIVTFVVSVVVFIFAVVILARFSQSG